LSLPSHQVLADGRKFTGCGSLAEDYLSTLCWQWS